MPDASIAGSKVTSKTCGDAFRRIADGAPSMTIQQLWELWHSKLCNIHGIDHAHFGISPSFSPCSLPALEFGKASLRECIVVCLPKSRWKLGPRAHHGIPPKNTLYNANTPKPMPNKKLRTPTPQKRGTFILQAMSIRNKSCENWD